MSRAQEQGRIDPAVEAAPAHGWKRWVSELGRSEPERVVGFGGILMLGFVVGVIMLYAFAWLANQVLAQQTAALDASAAALLQGYNSPQLTAAARFVSLLGSEAVLLFAAVLLVLFIWQRRWGAAYMLVLVTAGAQVLNNVLKNAFQRPRPEPVVTGVIAAQQFAFPSGHAMFSAAFYFYLVYLTWRLMHGWRRLVLIGCLVALVVLIGLSRIYLGVHYLSDVIAGYLVGFVWTDALILGGRLLVLRTHRQAAARTLML